MAGKPASRNWNDVQIALAALAMAATLGLWNIFAEPDLVKAKESAREPEIPPAEIPVVAGTPTAPAPVKILLGGVAPETVVVVQPPARRNNRNNGGGGTVTTTRSS